MLQSYQQFILKLMHDIFYDHFYQVQTYEV